MDKPQTLQLIQKAQREWADGRAIQYNRADGRVLNLSDNLVSPLNLETVSEFQAADGDEFGRRGKPGKMFSLHSSSALVCNVFDYWRRRPLAALVQACGIKGLRDDLRFEQKFPTGLEGTSPNLDLLLSCNGDRPATAIESKFTEPYYPAHRKGFSASYFKSDELWAGLAAYLAGACFASTEYNLYPYFMVAYTCAMVQIISRPLAVGGQDIKKQSLSKTTYDRIARPQPVWNR